MWPAALSLGLTAAVALLLGTLGHLAVGFGVLTDCTNACNCTKTACAPCRPAQTWLAAGAIGQGVLLLTSVVLLAVAALRPSTRRIVMLVECALLVMTVAWITASTAVARGSY